MTDSDWKLFQSYFTFSCSYAIGVIAINGKRTECNCTEIELLPSRFRLQKILSFPGKITTIVLTIS